MNTPNPSSESSALLRAAVIGCGGRGRAHMPGLLADQRLHLIALADVKRETAEALNSEFELGATIYEDHLELLDKERPEVVVLALWTNLHLPVFQACVDAGVRAVLSEKPMAATWGECRAIVELAERSGVRLTFCHQRRYAPGNRAVRKLLEAGRFGKIERMDLFSPPHLLDCGTHSVDQALSFRQEMPIKWAHGAVDLSSTVNFFGIPAEGMFTGMFAFEDGVVATIRTGGLDMDFWGGVRVVGSEGFIEVMWDGQVRRAVVYAEPEWSLPYVDEALDEQMVAYVRAAIDGLADGIEPETSHRHALRATEVLFALYESARRHERVDLPLQGVTGNPLFDMLEERKA